MFTSCSRQYRENAARHAEVSPTNAAPNAARRDRAHLAADPATRATRPSRQACLATHATDNALRACAAFAATTTVEHLHLALHDYVAKIDDAEGTRANRTEEC